MENIQRGEDSIIMSVGVARSFPSRVTDAAEKASSECCDHRRAQRGLHRHSGDIQTTKEKSVLIKGRSGAANFIHVGLQVNSFLFCLILTKS